MMIRALESGENDNDGCNCVPETVDTNMEVSLSLQNKVLLGL
jgi:hypothetical protein